MSPNGNAIKDAVEEVLTEKLAQAQAQSKDQAPVADFVDLRVPMEELDFEGLTSLGLVHSRIVAKALEIKLVDKTVQFIQCAVDLVPRTFEVHLTTKADDNMRTQFENFNQTELLQVMNTEKIHEVGTLMDFLMGGSFFTSSLSSALELRKVLNLLEEKYPVETAEQLSQHTELAPTSVGVSTMNLSSYKNDIRNAKIRLMDSELVDRIKILHEMEDGDPVDEKIALTSLFGEDLLAQL